MADNKLHITAELIRRYLEGKLDDKTMHAIERQALDDPFLAEALEGYALRSADQEPALSDLRSRLEKRVQPPKSGILRKIEYRWLAAASILILLSITAVMLMNRPVERQSDIAQADPLKKADTIQADTAIPRPMPPQEQKPEPASPQATEESKNAAPQATEASRPAPAKAVPPVSEGSKPAPAETEAASREIAKSVKEESKNTRAEAAVAADRSATLARLNASRQAAAKEKAYPQPALAMAKKESRPFRNKVDTILIGGKPTTDSLQLLAKSGGKVEGYIAGEPSPYSNQHTDANVRLISGVVIDEKTGSRLPGVMVSVHGSNRGAVTDTSGGFALHVDKKEPVKLGFSSIGYEHKDVTVAQSTSKVNVALPADEAALQDVVVVGYGKAKKAATAPPSPVMGEAVYQAYLQSKKIVPLKENMIPVAGEVHISFTVMPDSTLRNFKVLQSLGREADSAAISIVKEGPAWVPASNKKRTSVMLKVPIVIKEQE